MVAEAIRTTRENRSTEDQPLALTQMDTILERALLPGVQRLRLAGRDGQILAEVTAQQSEHEYYTWNGEATVPVLVHGATVARVHAWGSATSQELLAHTARLTGAWVADAWQAAEDISSMAGEIVHAYEELHLLYELGEALTGQLTVAHAAALLLEKIVQTLHPTWAELRLVEGLALRQAQHGVAPGKAPPYNADDHQLHTVLRTGGESIGEILLRRPVTEAPFSSVDGKLLDAVGTLAASALRNAHRYEELRRQADTDALTGLINHRAFQEQLDRELVVAGPDEPLAILMIDLDDFKLFNDTYGHVVGDQILRLIGEILRESCRATDVVGRYGGDEFIMLLPHTESAGALQIAQRILHTVQRRGISVQGRTELPLALSIGCAVYPTDARVKHDLLSHADAALYEIKHAGGNGVYAPVQMSAQEPEAPPLSTTFGALEGLVNVVDAKDRYTREHSDLVTQAAMLLARRLGLPPDTCSALRIAGVLHDVGKIGIPDRILRKPGPLEPYEYTIMQQHVVISELIIKEVPHLVDVLSAVASHHERFDGSGYPRGLRGEEIPFLGRIMAIADACSAMLLNRPYRKGLSWSEVVTELRRGKGTQFDPALVEPFIAVIEESGLSTASTAQPRSAPPPGSCGYKENDHA